MLISERVITLIELKSERLKVSNKLLKLKEYIYINCPNLINIDDPQEPLDNPYLAYCIMQARGMQTYLVALNYRIAYLEKVMSI